MVRLRLNDSTFSKDALDLRCQVKLPLSWDRLVQERPVYSTWSQIGLVKVRDLAKLWSTIVKSSLKTCLVRSVLMLCRMTSSSRTSQLRRPYTLPRVSSLLLSQHCKTKKWRKFSESSAFGTFEQHWSEVPCWRLFLEENASAQLLESKWSLIHKFYFSMSLPLVLIVSVPSQSSTLWLLKLERARLF